jgi:cytochrome d ubiquinol oxidase subunit II
MDMPFLFACAAAFGIIIYVLADGLDLGVGILFLLAPRDNDRDLMMASIEPVWDGNETWLVFGGTFLFAAFPPAYYILLPAFYVPIILMLFALIFRGVAFTFRAHARGSRGAWDFAFFGGSIIATFAQGLVLGGFVGGIDVENGVFAGSPLSFLSPLGVLCGLGLIGGYALMGAGWLVWKTVGQTQAFARNAGRAAVALTAIMMAVVSVWTAFSQPEVAERWFSLPNIAWLAPIPVVTAAALVMAWYSLRAGRGAEFKVFALSIIIFLCGFLGLCVSLWPYVVPRQITIWDGAADPQTLAFVGIGLCFVIPIVLAYQFNAYWVFRGKTSLDAFEGDADEVPTIWARRESDPHKEPHLP